MKKLIFSVVAVLAAVVCASVYAKTVFCILASSTTDAECKLEKYITIPPHRLR